MKIQKSFMVIFIFTITIIFCCSCDGNTTRDIRHAGYTLTGDTFTCSDLVPKDDEDTSYKKIKYYNNSYAITEDGEIYEISIGLKYANNENCKKAEAPFQVDAIFGDIARGKDGNFYYLTAQNNVAKYSAISNTDSNYQLYSLLLKDVNNIKIQTHDNNTGSYLILKNDGNIYNYTVSRTENNKEYVIVSSAVAYSKTEFNGNIIDFSYQGNSLGTFIRTDNAIYRLRAKNQDECSKFADVACEYEMSEDEAYLNHKDQILSFNGSTLITTYGKMFTVAS